MKKELQEKLYEEFPQLFQDRKLDIYQSPMARGITCGDGWFEIIRKACKRIMDSNPPEDFRFGQVKEKFGGLRIYPEIHYDPAAKIIEEAEVEASNTCEWCAETEGLVQHEGSRIITLCLDCHGRYCEGYRPWREQ